MNQSIKNQIQEVYSEHSRCYDFCSDEFVNRKDAYVIMKAACPRGYNEFRAELILEHFANDALFKLAREGSVCMYVKGDDLPSKKQLDADEYTLQADGTTRIWWD